MRAGLTPPPRSRSGPGMSPGGGGRNQSSPRGGRGVEASNFFIVRDHFLYARARKKFFARPPARTGLRAGVNEVIRSKPRRERSRPHSAPSPGNEPCARGAGLNRRGKVSELPQFRFCAASPRRFRIGQTYAVSLFFRKLTVLRKTGRAVFSELSEGARSRQGSRRTSLIEFPETAERPTRGKTEGTPRSFARRIRVLV